MKTIAGNVCTLSTAKILFLLPEFHKQHTIKASVHLLSGPLGSYDMIVGRDLLNSLGVVLDHNDKVCIWDEVAIPMRDKHTSPKEHFAIEESEAVTAATKRIKKILDAKYEPASLEEIADCNPHLSSTQQKKLENLLQNYLWLFDGSLGRWKSKLVDIELREDAKPYHA